MILQNYRLFFKKSTHYFFIIAKVWPSIVIWLMQVLYVQLLTISNSKALRCRFFGPEKIGAAQKVELKLLNRVRTRSSKNVLLRFSIDKYVYLKCFWTQLESVHQQGPCSLRSCSLRSYCITFWFCLWNSALISLWITCKIHFLFSLKCCLLNWWQRTKPLLKWSGGAWVIFLNWNFLC